MVNISCLIINPNILRKVMNKYYKKRKDLQMYQHQVEYTDDYTEEMDTEGLKCLRWSMFDSPDAFGSGKRFMENEPVVILDRVFKKERLRGFIEIGYTSKPYADKLRLHSDSSHRVGKAVKFRCINPSYRMRIVKGLILYGVDRIHLHKESIYFDTDSYLKKPELLFF